MDKVPTAPNSVFTARFAPPKYYQRGFLAEKDIAEIREFLEFARMAAISSAVVSGASFKIILNPEGSPDIAAREMLILIRNLVSRGKG